MSKNWDEFIFWATRFYQDLEDFDDTERNYKIVAADRAGDARRRLTGEDSTWVEVIRKPLGENLCSMYGAMEFRRWLEGDLTSLGAGLRRLWNESDSAAERIEGFLKFAPTDLQRSQLAEPGLILHMAMGVEKFPPYRVGKVEIAFRLTGFPTFKDMGIGTEYGKRYAHVLSFFDRVVAEAAQRGLQLRDRLDAQSVTWLVSAWEPLPGWPDSIKRAFVSFQKSGDSLPEPRKETRQSLD